MKGPPTGFWAKLDYDESGEVTAWHPLVCHSADVAAMAEALLRRTILGRRFAQLVGWDALSDVHVARLCVLAALHDAGKVNHGFQNRAFEAPGPRAGHVSPMVEVLESERSGYLLGALGVAPMLEWFSSELDLEYFLLATFGHHGRPVAPGSSFSLRLWEGNERRDPVAGLRKLAASIRAWFPRAFEEANPFPPVPALQHAFNGLLTLADWLGSDRRFFDFAQDEDTYIDTARRRAAEAVESTFLDPAAARRQLGSDPVGFETVSPYQPHGAQRACLEQPLHEIGALTILEAATGSGKTEAALARFIRLFQNGLVDGMYFAVPTRSAATQLHERVTDAALRAFPDAARRPTVTLAVPGYIRADDQQAKPLPGFEVLWPDEYAGEMQLRGWAAEHPKRFLAGPIVVGTIDQVLLSTLQVNHAHLRGSALLRQLLVVDEVHASDPYMTRLLDRVLDHHLAAGGHALLMSATLGNAARVRLTTNGRENPPSPEAAVQVPYPLITHVDAARRSPTFTPAAASGRSKSVVPVLKPLAGDPGQIARMAVEAARAGARVLVIRNLVRECIATQQAVEAEVNGDLDCIFRIGSTPAPHHSRFAPEDRRLLDDRIETVFGKDTSQTGTVAVATQTVEQSLDIDADLLITDLCPIDVLLQRIGRLHRHERERPRGFERARCIVLTPEDRDLSTGIVGGRNRGAGLKGPHGLGTVYQDLRTLEATWRILETDASDGAWTIPADNRRLVESGTHPERLMQIVDELDGAWNAHQEYIVGSAAADGQAAALVTIDRSKPFAAPANRFPDDIGQIKTRLGRDDYRVELPDPVIGPLGSEVRALTVTEWQIGEPPDELIAENVEAIDGGFRFDFCGRTFRYDRFGVAPLSSDD